jgi:hypothetical protein
MGERNSGGGFGAFFERLRSTDKGITEQEALLIYSNLDAVLALLAVPEGKRISINKSRSAE